VRSLGAIRTERIGMKYSIEMPLHHGLAMQADDTSGAFHHGLLRLFEIILVTFRFPRLPGSSARPTWPDIWIDSKYDGAVRKFQECFWTLSRAADHLVHAFDTLEREFGTTDLEKLAYSHAALIDVPIFSDYILWNLRVQADCIATALPNFYGITGKTVTRMSFRDHRTWFLEKRSEFDPEYSDVLRSSSAWFDHLAGTKKGEGLRNITTHSRGTYQMGGTVLNDVYRARAAMIDDRGFVCEDVLGKLKEILGGFFIYADQTYIHFLSRLGPLLGWSQADAHKKSVLYHVNGGLAEGYRLFPRVDTRE
jgi:hypothetical protein